ncbi:hypothetical protein K0C01_00450 [Salinarchaeum sp. IM2453]|uniref:hypothetical protein n=1 Tax=Salinarchaeum sp. IM2453 TaxID=2862870 RepID=UPI001C829E1C|nr:hypothetical protein [Salinarchaeum sp. IM2453]QZA88680.1 hypothetical protein K0C01_00450 [Salinarchaeum sp. IM2453]
MASDGDFLTRRQILARGAASVGISGIAGAFLSSPDIPTPESGQNNNTEQNNEVDRDEIPYTIWQYANESDGFRATAPINLVFPLEDATQETVIDVFRDAGWVAYPAEYRRYGWDRSAEEYRLQQWTGAESFFGQVGRYHVRCFATDGTLSIQAHLDTAPQPTHGIASYSDGKSVVEQLFISDGWACGEDELYLGNEQSDHNGYATVIRRSK